MTSKLHRIKNNFMNRELLQKSYASNISLSTFTMMKFLLENIKFLISFSSRNFTLKTLSSKISQKSTTIVQRISCDVLSNSAASKSSKEKSVKDKSNDLTLLTSIIIEKVHIHDETSETVTRKNVLWKEELEIVEQREKLAATLHNERLKKRIANTAAYKASITEWIISKRIWEYALIVNLFLTQDNIIVWFNEISKKNLVEYHITIEDNIVNESTMTMIWNELENENEFVEFVSNFSFLSFIYTSVIRTSKKMKSLKRKASDDTFEQKLHKNVQIIIISNFCFVNLTETIK
jgi:hypothetical protein